MPDEPLQNLLAHLQEDPGEWSLRARICDAMLLEGRLGEAVSLIDTAPAPPEEESHVLKVAEVYGLSQPQKAVPLLYAFLAANPSSALGHLAMAEAAAKLNQIAVAQSYYQRAVALNPGYRDPDFEGKHGFVIPGPVPAAASSRLASGLPTAAQAAGGGASRRRGEPLNPGLPGWVFTVLVAVGTFLICWMLLGLGLRAMLFQAGSPP